MRQLPVEKVIEGARLAKYCDHEIQEMREEGNGQGGDP